MLARVAPWIEGEILYSLLARTSRECVLGAPRSALAKLIGSGTAIPSIDLPSRLDSIFSRVGHAAGFASVEQMINGATLYPLLTLFLPEQRRQAILDRARGATGNGLKTSIGLVAQGFGASASLRCCLECLALSLRQFGDEPWLRLHQLPGVTVCALHRCRLIELPRQSAQGNRHRLLQPCERCSAVPAETAVHSMALRFAEMSRDLLLAGCAGTACSAYASVYRLGLQEAGMARGREQLDWPRLRRALQAGVVGWDGFPHLARLSLNSTHAPGWVRAALGGRDSAVHPICHLALIDVLFTSVSEFVEFFDKRQHLSKESNPDLRSLLRSDLDVDVLKDATLSCRQAAAQLGLSVTTVCLHRQRLGIPFQSRAKIKRGDLKPVLDALSSGAAVADVAKQHQWSLSAVYRLLSCHPSVREQRGATIETDCQSSYRLAWKLARRDAPDADLRTLRAQVPAVYCWLRRHESEWLDRHLPQRTKQNAKARVNWPQRDQDLADMVPTIAAAIRRLDQPLRAAAGAILRQIYPSGSWQRYRDRLPTLEKALSKHSETLDAFKDRKHRSKPNK